MNELRIRSVRDNAELVLSVAEQSTSGEYLATLTSPVVSARVRVYGVEIVSVSSFFDDLGVHWWTGWEGTKTYESLERQLTISATRDVVGHVALRVSMRDGMGGANWLAEATLYLESGHLEELAHRAREVFSRGNSRITMR